MISIVCPTFNSESYISSTIKSVLNQTYNNWELLIVDDGSTDRTNVVVNKFTTVDNRIKYYNRDREPKGASTCRNIGVSKSSGSYIIFLDSDDILAEYCLKQRIEVINNNSDLDFWIFLMSYFTNNNKNYSLIANKSIKDENEVLGLFLNNYIPWTITCPIWKKEAFLKLNGFDEDYKRLQDPELHIRALYSGMLFKTFYNFPPDSFYRIHEGRSDINFIILHNKKVQDSFKLHYKKLGKIISNRKHIEYVRRGVYAIFIKYFLNPLDIKSVNLLLNSLIDGHFINEFEFRIILYSTKIYSVKFIGFIVYRKILYLILMKNHFISYIK